MWEMSLNSIALLGVVASCAIIAIAKIVSMIKVWRCNRTVTRRLEEFNRKIQEKYSEWVRSLSPEERSKLREETTSYLSESFIPFEPAAIEKMKGIDSYSIAARFSLPRQADASDAELTEKREEIEIEIESALASIRCVTPHDDTLARYAPHSDARPSPREEAAQDSLRVFAGRLIHKIPRVMHVRVPEIIEVRVGAAQTPIPQQAMGIVGTGNLTVHNLPAVETMIVDLYCDGNDVRIIPLSNREQLVKKDVIRNSLLERFSAPYGQWKWSVLPLRQGLTTLTLHVSARVLDSRGLPTSHSLVPDREFSVSIRVNGKAVAWRCAKWLMISAPFGVLTALVTGAIENDLWPAVRSLLIDGSLTAHSWIESIF